MIEVECGVKAPIVGELNQAIRWFKTNGVHAWESDGSVYIEVDNDNFEVFNAQISASEISYRADCYRNER